VLILRSAGTNCDGETQIAFETVGAQVERVHLNRAIENPSVLDDYQILAVPGGFSYGDDIAAGRIFANQLMLRLEGALHGFVARKKPVIGICNGFQILVKTDILPGGLAGETGQTCTLTENDCRHFIDHWVKLERKSNKCIWTRNLTQIELPIAHGEGKFLCASDAVRKALWDNDQVALTYVGENPNGSTDAIAGICDASGLVFGLMPHPERHISPLQHYAWQSRESQPQEGDGLRIFRNAVEYVSK
jgi:phosphoribosylformylglycinamidine synthase